MRHLMLTMEAPLMAFGDEIVDAYGRVRSFPGASSLTGLFANALGWTRDMRAEHQALQERLRFAVRLDRAGELLRDFQTAKLEANDRGWTTRGVPEGRDGGANTYKSPHIRYRDYMADTALLVAVALDPVEAPPDLDHLAGALERPARPLFFGRKPCLPSRPLLAGRSEHRFIEAADPFEALARMIPELEDRVDSDRGPMLVGLDRIDLPAGKFERLAVADERNWISGVHGGSRLFARGRMLDLPASAQRKEPQ